MILGIFLTYAEGSIPPQYMAYVVIGCMLVQYLVSTIAHRVHSSMLITVDQAITVATLCCELKLPVDPLVLKRCQKRLIEISQAQAEALIEYLQAKREDSDASKN
jgi:hypothetical protein